MKTTAAAFVAIALAWAAPALGQNPPPQERIRERLAVSFRDAAGEFLGRLFLSDVTTSHSAVEGYLQGLDGYVFYCEPALLANRTWCRSKQLREALSRTSPTSFPCCRVLKSISRWRPTRSDRHKVFGVGRPAIHSGWPSQDLR